jgi:hypothetical protein
MSETKSKRVPEAANALPEPGVCGKATGAAQNAAARPAPLPTSPHTEASAAADAPRTTAAAPGPASGTSAPVEPPQAAGAPALADYVPGKPYIKGGAIIDHVPPRERWLVAVQK